MTHSKLRKYAIGVVAGALAFTMASSPAEAEEAAADPALLDALKAEASGISDAEILDAIARIKAGDVELTTTYTIEANDGIVALDAEGLATQLLATPSPWHSWDWWVPYWPCAMRNNHFGINADATIDLGGLVGRVRVFSTYYDVDYHTDCTQIVGGFPVEQVNVDVTTWGSAFNPQWNGLTYHNDNFFKWGSAEHKSAYGGWQHTMNSSWYWQPGGVIGNTVDHDFDVRLFGDNVVCWGLTGGSDCLRL